MGNVGFSEMLLLAVIALLIVGPRRLPEMARGLGRVHRMASGAWQNLRREFQAEIDSEHNQRIMDQARQAGQEMEQLAQQAKQSVEGLVSDVKSETELSTPPTPKAAEDSAATSRPKDTERSKDANKES